ncbi:FHA domain-containing protein [Curtobacterium sp. ISL-83]|uniref:FHA domain-containing protein n=1 Tax=Curtobacterium sp. ISL-83 TaxID=2819145 RepID=UPI001BECA9C4|nr:FHA domain-containing protein [Curtobacterium sp. ISL-83]MBT2503314.1 FHA domain-containing protein [Curtobacterium sp. ISL-83]
MQGRGSVRDDSNGDDGDGDDTVIRRARPRSAGALGADPAAPLGADPAATLDDDPFGDTVIRPPSRPSSQPDDGPDGDTVLRPRPRADAGGPAADAVGVADSVGSVGSVGSVDDTVVRAPRRPASSVADIADVPPGLPTAVRQRIPSIRVGDRVLRLDRPVVVGRRPSAPRIATGDGTELVTVPSRSGQVSSSHVRLHASGEAAVVEDLRSTNGTVVRPAAGAPWRMPSGASIVALTGTVVEIGDGNVIEILSPHLRVAADGNGLPPFPAPGNQVPVVPTDHPSAPPETR